MKIGYARVSTKDQNLDRQIESLTKYGCDLLFKDKKSGKNTDRPEFQKMITTVKPGDVLVIHELSRLGRSLRDLILTADKLREMGVELVSLSEKIDTTNPWGRLAFNIFGSMAEFARELTLESINEGIAVAKANGRRIGRQFTIQTPEQVAVLKMYAEQGMSIYEMAAKFGITRQSMYKYLHRYGLMELYQEKQSLKLINL
jgi:DNA invertase Pin-like site-specific DNA recombinase